MESTTVIDFAQILTWVTSLTSALTGMFTSLSHMWVLFVPLVLGVFGYIFAKVRGLTRGGLKKKP